MNTHGAEAGGSAGSNRRRRPPVGPSHEGKGGGRGRLQQPRPPVAAVVALSASGERERERERAMGRERGGQRGTPSPHPKRSREMGRGACFSLEQKLCVYIRFLRFGAKAGAGRKRLRRSRLSGREAGGAGPRGFGFKRSEPHETRSDSWKNFRRRGQWFRSRSMSGLSGLKPNPCFTGLDWK
jgi:hypothetical protein